MYIFNYLLVFTCVSIRKGLDVFSNSHFKIFWSYELVKHIDNWGPFTVSNLVKNLWNLRSIYYRAQDMWITSFPSTNLRKFSLIFLSWKTKFLIGQKKAFFSQFWAYEKIKNQNNDILFWPTVRKNCFSYWEFIFFEIQTMKVRSEQFL